MTDINNSPSNNIDGDSLEIVSPNAIESIERAGIYMSIATAHKFRRDIAAAIRQAEAMACRNQKFAEKMHYAVPKGGRTRVGPSINFAKVLIQSWQNCTAVARVIEADRYNVRLQGVCHDLESNVRIAYEMEHPVQAPRDLESEGVEGRWRFQVDNAKRAGRSIVLRDVIFAVIPVVLFDDVLEKAKLVALGTGKSFEEKRSNAIAACKDKKISQPMIYKALGVAGLESITADDLIWLKSALQNIEDNLDTVESLFGPPETVKAQVPKRTRSTTSKEEPREPEQPASEVTEPSKPPLRVVKAEPQSLFPQSDDEERRTDLVNKLKEAGLSFEQFAHWLQSIGAVSALPANVTELRDTLIMQAVDNWDANLTALRNWMDEARTT